MDDGRRIGQRGAKFVMIGDDQFESKTARRVGLRNTGNAAIDGNDQFRSLLSQDLKRFVVESVAFINSVRNVISDLAAEQAQALHEQAGAGDAVDIVVAIDGDALAGGNSAPDAV